MKNMLALCLVIGALFGGPAAKAGELAKPAGEVVLTIDGAIGMTNADGRAEFDMDMLRALPLVAIETSTPWTTGRTIFEGIPVDVLLNAVDARGGKITAVALNDYIAEVDVPTLRKAGAILAYRVDGAEISIRDKGPLWIMFPFDAKPELKAESVYSQSVWQLRKMTVRE